MTADLQDLFDRAGRNAPPPVLDPDAVVQRARRSRNRRVWMSAAAVGVAAAAVAVVVFAAGGLHQASPLPPSHPLPTPSPDRSLFTLAADPFLTPVDISFFRVVREDRPAPPWPSDCLSDPRTWGATESGVRTYTDPHQADLVINEFVLRYDDAAGAHRAVLDARNQLTTCTSPTDVGFPGDPGPSYTGSAGDSVGIDPTIAEYFAQPRNLFPDGTDTQYTVRVARAGNLLVVIEDTGPDKRGVSNANVTLTVAMRRAVQGSDMVAPPWCPETAC